MTEPVGVVDQPAKTYPVRVGEVGSLDSCWPYDKVRLATAEPPCELKLISYVLRLQIAYNVMSEVAVGLYGNSITDPSSLVDQPTRV